MAVRPPSRLHAFVLIAAILAAAGGSAGDVPARSDARPANLAVPTITGTAQEGQTVTGHNGSWVCEPPYVDPDTGEQWTACKYDFQWQRCDAAGVCADIAGAASQNYVVAPADRGSALRVAVTATNYDCNEPGTECRYSSATAYSALTSVVPGAPPAGPPPPPEEEEGPPVSKALPVVAGPPQEGQTVTAGRGDWSGLRPMNFSYQWSRCVDPAGGSGTCSPVAGATGSSYAVESLDVGTSLKVTVTASNEAGSASATSQPSETVVAVPNVVPAAMASPSVFGRAKEGETLTGTPGSWTASPPPTFTFGWLRCSREGEECLPIEGANAMTYVAGAADGGRMLRLVVTAANRAGAATATSPPTAVVEPKGLLHLLDGRDSVPATGVIFPDGLRLDRVRFWTRDGRTIRGSFHVSDTRGYVVRGALVSVRGLRAGETSRPAPRATSTDGSVSVSFTVNASKLRKGGRLVVVVRATKPGDSAAASVAHRVVVTLRLPKRR